MPRLVTLLFIGGFAFLLISLTVAFGFGAPPMAAGEGVLRHGVADTGAANLVTAVVLGFRGIDTLGELSILFAAATAGGLVLGSRHHRATAAPSGLILRAGSRLLFPLMLVVGLYIVLHGHLTPGGGFQGGVILAAAFFLPVLAGTGDRLDHTVLRVVEGLAGSAFIIIGIVALATGGAFLEPLLVQQGDLYQLFSAGTLPLLYLAVGLKVGAELAGLLATLAQPGPEAGG